MYTPNRNHYCWNWKYRTSYITVKAPSYGCPTPSRRGCVRMMYVEKRCSGCNKEMTQLSPRCCCGWVLGAFPIAVGREGYNDLGRCCVFVVIHFAKPSANFPCASLGRGGTHIDSRETEDGVVRGKILWTFDVIQFLETRDNIPLRCSMRNKRDSTCEFFY